MNYDLIWVMCLYHPHTPEGMVYLRNITTEDLDKYNTEGHPLGEFTVSPITYDRNFELESDDDKWALFINETALRQRGMAAQVIKRRRGEVEIPKMIMWGLVWIVWFALAVLGGLTILYFLLAKEPCLFT